MFLSQVVMHNGIYDDGLEFVQLEHVQIVSSMAPASTLGHHPLATRLAANLRVYAISYPTMEELFEVYSQMVGVALTNPKYQNMGHAGVPLLVLPSWGRLRPWRKANPAPKRKVNPSPPPLGLVLLPFRPLWSEVVPLSPCGWLFLNSSVLWCFFSTVLGSRRGLLLLFLHSWGRECGNPNSMQGEGSRNKANFFQRKKKENINHEKKMNGQGKHIAKTAKKFENQKKTNRKRKKKKK